MQRVVAAPAALNMLWATVAIFLFSAAIRPDRLGFDGAAVCLSAMDLANAVTFVALSSRLVPTQETWPAVGEWRAAFSGWGEIFSRAAPAAVIDLGSTSEHLPSISPPSPLYPLYLPAISPPSPRHLPAISPPSPQVMTMSEWLAWESTLFLSLIIITELLIIIR